MARKKAPKRKSQPKQYFFFVEGCTEENYIQLLKTLYRQHQQVAKPQNCNGGSARHVLMEAKRFIPKYGPEYLGYVIWFDKDRYFSSDNQLKHEVEKLGAEIYISDPCIEHWLLAHFQPINLSENQDCRFYEKKLKKHISNYHKNDCQLLKAYINDEKIKIAIKHYPEIGKISQKYFIN